MKLVFGFIMVICLVIGNMIGLGVFVMSGYLLVGIGNCWWVMFVWFFGSVIVVCGVIGYGVMV